MKKQNNLNLTKLYILISNKHIYFSLLTNKNLCFFCQTTHSDKFINFQKNSHNIYLIGLKLKLFLLKIDSRFPVIFFNKKKSNAYLKLLLKALI